MSETPMNISKPVFKNEVNIGTIAALFGMTVIFAGWIWTASETKTEILSWQNNHDAMHQAQIANFSGFENRTDQRLVSLERATGKLEHLEYRLTVQEQGSASLAKSVEELKATVNGQSADIRVMLEILKRLDNTAKTQ